jgi:hypothetical protein
MAVDIADSFAEPAVGGSLGHARDSVVAVDRGSFQSRAVCTCGWQGAQHLLLSIAIHEAHLHSARNGCRPAVPLMIRDLARQAFTFAANFN